MIGHLILRLSIWFLLTANFTLENIIIGILIALLLPRSYTKRDSLKELLQVLGKILIAIPQAYIEAFEMLLHPHNEEDIVMERVSANRSSRLIFLDVFLITFTPKTIVVKYNEEACCYEVHRVGRRKRS
ncbi:MAG: cation:proton antiporter [Oscillatoriales cyanobacterium RU_3_3]|nr:cation:proton antiporter [Microcoleus sp. SU_5_6]NJL69253.1 cation:proton antiporter [Microcoleus sp. SM1_3_4]NJM60971.1 cation:proton antiporter [Oscillatoriales cyanobacterium RU_3_3]